MRPWQGAEIWINPELDQGFGFDNTHGLAGFVSGEAFKLGFSYPYARLQRLLLRQTINLGGDVSKLDADSNQFADTVTANRLVLTDGASCLRRSVMRCAPAAIRRCAQRQSAFT